ncbi:hypothetical protein [Nitrosomonas sp.]|uniref:hypothetical protein n=1 Tax=Nitrosomonas sp. TaxID=42353 RepID=UPI0025D9ADC9|nr:hypothetical protein [Nitrosomonas sp.]
MKQFADQELEALLNHIESDLVGEKQSFKGMSPKERDRQYALSRTICPITINRVFYL